MKTFKQHFLTEGGAGGHMAHPFDLHTVHNGKDLINFFDKAYIVVKKDAANKNNHLGICKKILSIKIEYEINNDQDVK